MALIARTDEQRKIATDKLNSYIASARDRSGPALARIMGEVPQDQIVRASALAFTPDYDGHTVRYAVGGVERAIHNNALGQMADKTGIPMAYIRHLQDTGESWAMNLLARTMGDHFAAMPAATRLLTRSVHGETRAVLSDKFRRIDCRPGLDALVKVATERKAIIGDAVATDTRVSVRLILPTVHEIAPGEFVVVGLSWDNSDYGRGAQTLRLFVLRLFCWNGATLETALRSVHLGARLADDVSYSERTYTLDAAATVSAIRDTATALLGDDKVRDTTRLLGAAAAEKIDPKTKIEALRKKIGKGLADKVSEAYNRPDVEDLPAGNTAWRWSNALSWVAGHSDDAETRIDLERLAGDALKVA